MVKLPSLKRQPKWYEDASYIFVSDSLRGYIFLPHSPLKKLNVYEEDNGEAYYLASALIDRLNQPKLWKRLANKVKPSKAGFKGFKAFDLAIAEHEKGQLPKTVIKRKASRGKVIKGTKPVEFSGRAPRTGGRVVRVMPRQLQKMKAAQEKIEADHQPKIED